ncbi:MAG: SCO family protein [Acidobacteriota bacterium]
MSESQDVSSGPPPQLPPPASRPITTPQIFLWALLVAALITLAGLTWWTRQQRVASAQPAPGVLFALPEFSLTDSDGQALSRRDLEGSPWIASFIFTRCGGVCPLITEQMKALGKRFPAASRVARVSITVDPEFDTPAVLADYATKHGVGSLTASRWHFLTGPPQVVRPLILQGFHLALEQGATPQEPILHSTRLMLVDRYGKARGTYEYDDPQSMDRLIVDLSSLLAE